MRIRIQNPQTLRLYTKTSTRTHNTSRYSVMSLSVRFLQGLNFLFIVQHQIALSETLLWRCRWALEGLPIQPTNAAGACQFATGLDHGAPSFIQSRHFRAHLMQCQSTLLKQCTLCRHPFQGAISLVSLFGNYWTLFSVAFRTRPKFK